MMNSVQFVMASESNDLDGEAKKVLKSFTIYLKEGDKEVYNCIDTSNTELYNNVKNYMNDLSIKYSIKEVKEENDVYVVKTKINASGEGWKVSGFTVNVMSFIIKILLIIFGVLFVMGIIVVTIVIVIIKLTNKKN